MTTEPFEAAPTNDGPLPDRTLQDTLIVDRNDKADAKLARTRSRGRRLLVLAATAFAVLVPAIQMLSGLGLSQAEFAADGNQTLRVAGYAFSIWSLIYLGLIAYAVWQMTAAPETPLLRRLAMPSVVAMFGIGFWIIVAALNLKAASVVVIFASLLALLIPLLLLGGSIQAVGMASRTRWLVVWPLAALAGWLTVAAPLNLITTATALQALPVALSPMAWALLAVVVTASLGLIVTLRLRTLAYPLPMAWGLIGAFVAEQAENPVVGFGALAAALILVVGSVIIVFQLKRDRPEPDEIAVVQEG